MDNKLATICIILVVSALLSTGPVSRVNALSIRPPRASSLPVSPEYDEDSGGGGAGGGDGGGGGGWGGAGVGGGADLVSEDEFDDEQEELVNWAEEDVQSLTKRILKSLGLKKIPDVSKIKISAEEMEIVNQKYLKHVEDMERHRRAAENHDNGEQVLLYSYQNKSNVQLQNRVQLNNNNQTSTLMYFPVDNLTNITRSSGDVVGDSDAVISATLHLKHYTNPRRSEVPSKNYKSGQNQISDSVGDAGTMSRYPVVISVYRVTGVTPRQQMELLDSKTVPVDTTSASSKWGADHVTLDVTSAVLAWVRDASANLGLVITCSHCDRLTTVSDGGATDRDHRQPSQELQVRVVTSGAHQRSKRSTAEDILNAPSGSGRDCVKNKGGGQRHCCRKPLNVSFEELDMDKWVVKPKFFNSYYCLGKCPFRYNPAHNHAVVQSLLHRRDKKRAPKLCCTPSIVSDLRMWYFDDSDPPTLKEAYWKGVVVEKCGCS